jgi:alpha-beta hydrolase superfamily lysophospholipase
MRNMHFFKCWLLLFLSLGTACHAAAQNILQDYFHGNKDSLLATAAQLIAQPDPVFQTSAEHSHADSATLANLGFEQVYASQTRFFQARDGKKIGAYRFAGSARQTIVLVHGVASSAFLYNRAAGLLQAATGAEVYTVDLRGHGQSEGRPGDVDYLNQYADDLSDVVRAISKEKPGGKIILAGHSMGGGVALRYAAIPDAAPVDGFLLLAPLLGHNAPSIPQGTPASGAAEAEPFLKIHLTRLIGISMLNDIGDHHLDSLPVLFFNLPAYAPLRQYTFRANVSMAPVDYQQGLQAVKAPLLVLVGSHDEAFLPQPLLSAVQANSKGEVHLIADATHNSVRHDARTFAFIRTWFAQFQ